MTAAANRIISESWRVLLSGLLGVIATVGLMVGLVIIEHVVLPEDSTTPLDERVPALWVLTLPARFWGGLLDDYSSALIATLLTYVTIFSLAAYLILRRCNRPLRLL